MTNQHFRFNCLFSFEKFSNCEEEDYDAGESRPPGSKNAETVKGVPDTAPERETGSGHHGSGTNRYGGLNRGTFYLHYKDVFDLLEKTEAELMDEFNSLVMSYDAKI